MHLLPFASILLTASALTIPLDKRAGPDPDCEDPQDIFVYDDGPTSDKSAGIGAEFESLQFRLQSKNPCSADDTNAARKQLIEDRHGTNWELTADSTGKPGVLNAEYILDGTKIKVGNGDAETAGKAISDDLIGWAPWQNPPDKGKNTVNINNNQCNPWEIFVKATTKPEDIYWSPQITTSMPLEALYQLMQENVKDPKDKNILDGDNFRYPPANTKLMLVTKDYFQSKPNNIDDATITDDVLAFCTLVLSYAKAATQALQPEQSPKLYTTFMPRTEFNTIFGFVKSKIPGDLFQLFNTLACYKTSVDNTGAFNVAIDTNFCGGTVQAPQPGQQFSSLEYSQPSANVKIQDWISKIGNGDANDLLTVFDKSIDGSIGGLGAATENLYNTQRAAPLFEFRDLLTIQTSDIQKFMTNVDSSIQTLHNKYANPPSKVKRDTTACKSDPDPSTYPSDTPAQASASSSTASSSPASSATPTPTIAPVDPPSQPSCVANPSSPVKDAHEDELKKAADFFCSQYATNTNAAAPVNTAATIIAGDKAEGRAVINIAYVWPPSLGNQDDVYDFSITSVGNCTPANGNNLASPVANVKCTDIMYNAWKNCYNQGRGGQITAGCLNYSVKTKF